MNTVDEIKKNYKEFLCNDMIFWLDKFEGEAEGGYFVRNDLKDMIEKLKKNGKIPVGIKYDGSYNLEIIVRKD